ncbi:unnamed protein product [Musa hybrid cultivar]
MRSSILGEGTLVREGGCCPVEKEEEEEEVLASGFGVCAEKCGFREPSVHSFPHLWSGHVSWCTQAAKVTVFSTNPSLPLLSPTGSPAAIKRMETYCYFSSSSSSSSSSSLFN